MKAGGEEQAGPARAAKWFFGNSRGAVGESGSATGEDGTESRFGQDARDSVTVLALNLDPSFLHGASGTTSLLHFFRQPLLLWLTDTDKSCDNCHRLPTPVRGRTNDIHPPTISFWCGWCLISWIASRWLGSSRRQILQRSERTLPCEQLITHGNVFLFFHAVCTQGRKVSLKQKILQAVLEPVHHACEMVPDTFFVLV